ncbi:metallo-mystery pair system four-Cys motif protein [Waterburya agarophytonicola K14]|uniref:Metallo-mystery pair system four-Cys motif protein n=1 Tax=Waterburya agarophytonicola KI4 TaxID=2874699 RepID=A0A964BVX9_9CYAN|nr:MbnP family copper-binding protein [Waterburya agarophytonicola]MCC0179392.1 metallo-mystery pair system four-Cys motif protein [Waterburya agarophytonicola KI4]
MTRSFNRKSTLIATVIAFSSYGVVQAQSNTQEVAINFEAWVGEDRFACGESYDNIGTAESTITPTDFRLYISNVALIDEDNNAVPLELEQDGKWQYENTALLDFEDGTDGCDNGTTETNSTIVGTIPEGDYQSLQFTLGVPKNLNHDDAAIAPSPLNLTSMWWNWQGGYKFLRVDLETDDAIANVSSSTTTSQGDGNVQINQQHTTTNREGGSHTTTQTNNQTSIFQNGQGTHTQTSSTKTEHEGMTHEEENASSNSYLIHLGSTGCKDSAKSDLFGCANPNRTIVTLSDFDPDDNVVVADLAELLYESDLSSNQANTPTGCISSPEDSDCSAIIQRLGMPFNGATSEEGQNFFFVE